MSVSGQQISVNDAMALLAALVNRSGGNVKIKASDFNKIDGKRIDVVQGKGFVRIKVSGGGQ